ncbi:MAG: protein kinase [Eubacteriaceae bacterium]|nr:protein kinase [Eubacteriaceae bacterium]
MEVSIHNYEPLWGSWKIGDIIGEGPYSKVYHAHHEELGFRYEAAVKHISLPVSSYSSQMLLSEGLSEKDIKAFYAECAQSVLYSIHKMLQLKRSKNIVSIEDFKAIERTSSLGFDILVRMELLDSLARHIAKTKMGAREIAKMGHMVACAIAECELVGISHSSITPFNIFVSQSGDYKLGDAGISNSLYSAKALYPRERSYIYASPEQLNSQDSGAKADVYALGTVMYTIMNAGTPPFFSPGQQYSLKARQKAVAMKQSAQPVPLLGQADAKLCEIIAMALVPNPQQRITAQTLAEYLERYLSPSYSLGSDSQLQQTKTSVIESMVLVDERSSEEDLSLQEAIFEDMLAFAELDDLAKLGYSDSPYDTTPLKSDRSFSIAEKIQSEQPNSQPEAATEAEEQKEADHISSERFADESPQREFSDSYSYKSTNPGASEGPVAKSFSHTATASAYEELANAIGTKSAESDEEIIETALSDGAFIEINAETVMNTPDFSSELSAKIDAAFDDAIGISFEEDPFEAASQRAAIEPASADHEQTSIESRPSSNKKLLSRRQTVAETDSQQQQANNHDESFEGSVAESDIEQTGLILSDNPFKAYTKVTESPKLGPWIVTAYYFRKPIINCTGISLELTLVPMPNGEAPERKSKSAYFNVFIQDETGLWLKIGKIRGAGIGKTVRKEFTFRKKTVCAYVATPTNSATAETYYYLTSVDRAIV